MAVLQGEKMVFDIQKMGIRAGTATLFLEENVSLDGKILHRITFTATSLNFYDKEKIYIDIVNYLPVIVDRDLNIFGKKEQIREIYEADKGLVRIIKTAGGKKTTQTIRKTGTVDNIYAFIFRYRKAGTFVQGDSLLMNLPTQNVRIHLLNQRKIRIGGKEYLAHYMESRPAKYRVWFDAGSGKVPLRIDGAVGFGKTSMILSEHTFKTAPKHREQ